jgi:AcrR family transcriptional regulator
VARGSDETRSLLIRTALELFAKHGVGNVSLRAIGAAAGQGNTGVLQYYFGTRDGLLRAIVEDFSPRTEAFAHDLANRLPAHGAKGVPLAPSRCLARQTGARQRPRDGRAVALPAALAIRRSDAGRLELTTT